MCAWRHERIADDPLIEELEAQSAEYAEGVEGEPPAPFAARGKDESAREEAAEAQELAESLGLSIGCKVGLKGEEGTYVLLALVTDEDGPCAILGETHGGVSTVPLASFAESGLEVRGRGCAASAFSAASRPRRSRGNPSDGSLWRSAR